MPGDSKAVFEKVVTRDALSSLYGAGHVNVTRTRECVAMPGTRDQVVLSPPEINTGLLRLWEEGVAYDPCGAEPHAAGDLVVKAERSTTTRGLIDPWPHRTYGNPPYGKSLLDPEIELPLLREEERIRAEAKAAGKSPKWPKGSGLPLKKAGLWDWLTMQLANSKGESVVLAPNRTNRRWMRAWRANVNGLVELDPLKFVGHPQAFPAPLVLGFVGPDERVPAFHAAFSHLGDPVLPPLEGRVHFGGMD